MLAAAAVVLVLLNIRVGEKISTVHSHNAAFPIQVVALTGLVAVLMLLDASRNATLTVTTLQEYLKHIDAHHACFPEKNTNLHTTS